MNPIASLIQGIEGSLRAGIEQDIHLQQSNQQLAQHHVEFQQLHSKSTALQYETSSHERQLVELHTAFEQLSAENTQQAEVWDGIDAGLTRNKQQTSFALEHFERVAAAMHVDDAQWLDERPGAVDVVMTTLHTTMRECDAHRAAATRDRTATAILAVQIASDEKRLAASVDAARHDAARLARFEERERELVSKIVTTTEHMESVRHRAHMAVQTASTAPIADEWPADAPLSDTPTDRIAASPLLTECARLGGIALLDAQQRLAAAQRAQQTQAAVLDRSQSSATATEAAAADEARTAVAERAEVAAFRAQLDECMRRIADKRSNARVHECKLADLKAAAKELTSSLASSAAAHIDEQVIVALEQQVQDIDTREAGALQRELDAARENARFISELQHDLAAARADAAAVARSATHAQLLMSARAAEVSANHGAAAAHWSAVDQETSQLAQTTACVDATLRTEQTVLHQAQLARTTIDEFVHAVAESAQHSSSLSAEHSAHVARHTHAEQHADALTHERDTLAAASQQRALDQDMARQRHATAVAARIASLQRTHTDAQSAATERQRRADAETYIHMERAFVDLKGERAAAEKSLDQEVKALEQHVAALEHGA